MTPIQFIALLASSTAVETRANFARSVLSVAREPADGALQTLSLQVSEAATIDLPIRMIATATPLPDQVRSVEIGQINGVVNGLLIIVNDEIGIGLVARGGTLAINVARPE